MAEAGIWNVLPVEAGDRRRYRDDRCPSSETLGYFVEFGALLVELRVGDPVDAITCGVDGLGGANRVVVDVFVIRRKALVAELAVGSHQPANDLVHGCDNPPQR